MGFIGLGAMGSNMAAKLIEKGFKLIVYNRTRRKAEEFAKVFSAELAEDPKHLASKADFIHIMVSDDHAVNEVVFSTNGLIKGLRHGSTVIQCSTITPMASKLLKKSIDAVGGKYVEAPVLGSVSEAREGRLMSFIGGNREDTEIATIKAYSKEVIYVGPVPSAAALKLAINHLFLGFVPVLGESVALAEAWGISYSKLFGVLRKTWLKPFIDRYEARALNPDFPTRFTIALASKDEAYVAEALRFKGIPGVIASTASHLYANATSQGYGSKDYSNIVYFLKGLSSRSLDKG